MADRPHALENIRNSYGSVETLRSWLLALLLLLPPTASHADEFSVTPMGLALGPRAKSGAITVANESDQEKTFQLRVSSWTHDAAGKETYEETGEIIFFPKVVTLAPKKQQIVRVGYRGAFPQAEKAFRIFISQIPGPSTDAKRRVAVSFTLQFAVPVFVNPAVARASGDIENLAISKGVLNVTVRNTGNVHGKFTQIRAVGRSADGREAFVLETPGWYVLPGAIRSYRFPVPAEQCRAVSSVEVAAISETLTVKRSVNVSPDMCGQE